ncbi:hypothetical protein GCM10023335_42640 [Streptomyces siamensis]|uniref:Uncharacterized protein n=1 Tax=Streptomyces siamensis TaxID=1274986 RepID=A0ABP9J2U1_9ACTN
MATALEGEPWSHLGLEVAEDDDRAASFLDDRVGGSGSKRAVNALRAALEEGKFVEYHEVLYANQPEESVDGCTDA